MGFHFRIIWSNPPSFPFCVFWIVSLCSILLMGSFSGLKKYSKDCLQCPKVLLISCNGKIVWFLSKQVLQRHFLYNSHHLGELCSSVIAAWLSALLQSRLGKCGFKPAWNIPLFLVTWSYFCHALTLKYRVFNFLFFYMLEAVRFMASEILSKITTVNKHSFCLEEVEMLTLVLGSLI